jgi:hypothetical protein
MRRGLVFIWSHGRNYQIAFSVHDKWRVFRGRGPLNKKYITLAKKCANCLNYHVIANYTWWSLRQETLKISIYTHLSWNEMHCKYKTPITHKRLADRGCRERLWAKQGCVFVCSCPPQHCSKEEVAHLKLVLVLVCFQNIRLNYY